MKNTIRILSFLALLSLLAGCTAVAPPAAAPTAETAAQAAPAGNAVVVADVQREPAPAFDSACTAADEGKVVPADVMPDRPLKIAVLGLENNPFWIPVKDGAMKAAEELKAHNVTVDWIVPGDNHTAEIFGKGMEGAMAQEYDAIATIAGDAGMAPYIDTAVEAGVPGGDLQL